MRINRLAPLGAAMLFGASPAWVSAQVVEQTTPPDPPTFTAQSEPSLVLPSEIWQFKALPEYHEPNWVTKNFVDKGRLPPVKDRLPKEPMVFMAANMPDGIGVYGDRARAGDEAGRGGGRAAANRVPVPRPSGGAG